MTIHRATVEEILQKVIGGLSMPVPANVFTSTDPTARTMRILLNEVMEELIEKYDFQSLISTWNFMTDGSAEYDLPDDWKSWIPNTVWNASTAWPSEGPQSPQTYRTFKTGLIGINTIATPWTIRGDKFVLVQATTGQNIVLDYISNYWCLGADTEAIAGAPKRIPTLATDMVRLPESLVKIALRRRWRSNKGYDTLKDDARYYELLNAAKINSGTPKIIELVRCPSGPLGNVPDTGYGQ